MPQVVGVVFSAGGQVQPFDPDGLTLAWNERVICNTVRGREYGRVVQPNHDASPGQGQLRRVLRRASTQDEATRKKQRAVAERAMKAFKRLARERGIAVKPYTAETVFDGGRVVLLYGSEERLDLREISSAVSSEVGTRVELRSVGPRDGARSLGGGGMCGETLCSSRFPSYEKVTLRMAKDQDLPMNPGRITGLCGRLRCCLAFEHPLYKAFRDRAPAVGTTVETPRGRALVRSYRVQQEAIVVRIEGGDLDEIVTLDELADAGRRQAPEK